MRLGDIHRPEGCVLPHSGTSGVSEVPQDSGRGKVFQFKALPFGLSPAPREFCRVTGILGTLLHKLTIYLHLYLDDWLLRAISRAICLAHTQIVLGKAQALGQVGTCPDSEVSFPRRGLQSSSWASQAFRGSSRKGPGPLQSTAQTIPPDSSFSVRGSQLCSRHHSLQAATYETYIFLIAQWSMASQPFCVLVRLNEVFFHHLWWWEDRHNLTRGVPLTSPNCLQHCVRTARPRVGEQP